MPETLSAVNEADVAVEVLPLAPSPVTESVSSSPPPSAAPPAPEVPSSPQAAPAVKKKQRHLELLDYEQFAARFFIAIAGTAIATVRQSDADDPAGGLPGLCRKCYLAYLVTVRGNSKECNKAYDDMIKSAFVWQG